MWAASITVDICADCHAAWRVLGIGSSHPIHRARFRVHTGLHVDPIARSGVEVASETQGGLYSNPSLAGNDTGDPVGRHMQRLGQAVHGSSRLREDDVAIRMGYWKVKRGTTA